MVSNPFTAFEKIGGTLVLTMPGVDTLVLGVKDRKELCECLAVEKAGPLDAETIQEIDASLNA